MSGAADEGVKRQRAKTRPSRRRRPLRVPVLNVAAEVVPPPRRGFTATEPPSGVTDSIEPAESALETLPGEPAPDAPRDLHRMLKGPASADMETLPGDREPTLPSVPLLGRSSEPAEELSLEDAEEIARAQRESVAQPPPLPSGFDPPTDEQLTVPALPWYEDFFGEHYLRTVRPLTPREVSRQCDFIESALALAPGARVLDVGCGLGMQAVELAARNYDVVGIDISPVMLARAEAEAADRGVPVAFEHGDMRGLLQRDEFDAAYCWGTTFGYFDDAGNRQTLESCHAALKPGGVLLLEMVNRDHIIGNQPTAVWFELDASVCMEETHFDYRTSRLVVKRNVASEIGDQRERQYSIRLYALHELVALLEQIGFFVAEISGREATPGVFFGVDSPKVIVRAEKLDDAAGVTRSGIH